VKIPRWALVIGALAAILIVFTFVWERVDPRSGEIEKIGRTEIAQATGHTVTSIKCERNPQIQADIDLPCTVALDDGTKFDTVAHVNAHRRYANHYWYEATFSPIPGGHPTAGPTHTPYVRSPKDAGMLGACIQAAGSDPAKIQACTAGM